MNDISPVGIIPPMSDASIEKVRRLERFSLDTQKQIDLPVDHFIHGGMYARTITLPVGIMITGALIKLATTLIVAGHCVAYIGDEFIPIVGYKVIAASAHRKQIFIAKKITNLTMLFPTQAKTVKEAEEQMTDEYNLLHNRGEKCHLPQP